MGGVGDPVQAGLFLLEHRRGLAPRDPVLTVVDLLHERLAGRLELCEGPVFGAQVGVFSRRFGKRLCGDRKAWARRSESAPRPAGVYPACTPSSVMAAVWRRMLGPASCTISALEMIRFRIDSAITASWRDLYQSSGSN